MKADEFKIIAQSVIEQMPISYNNPEKLWSKQVSIGSHKKFESILNHVENLAKNGYGSVNIKLDKTTDMFMVKESKSRFYSEQEVCTLLINEGFKLTPIEDFYEAQSYHLIWHDDLVKSYCNIGMDI